MTTQANQPEEKLYPFQFWWGIAGSAALILLILLVGPYSEGLELYPDKGPFWYYWILNEPTWITRATAWGGYFLHQLSMWWLIYYAQVKKPKYGNKLHWFNVLALGLNLFFIILHILQTKVWYDGLAQDVPEWTSFASVAFLLFMVLVMENQRRGIALGKKVGWLIPAGQVLRKYHGYYFSWAAIYTFWYHPIEITYGHLFGFFYMFLILIQGSIFFTNFHTNKWWTVFIETFVIIHAIFVAFFTIETMAETTHGGWHFLFGWVLIFLVTQVYGLDMTRMQRTLTWVAFLIAVPLAYTLSGRWDEMPRMFVIPLGSYMMVFAIGILIWMLWLLPKKLLNKSTGNT